ncbi:acyltransferase family protein [Klebsiella spallanzanii]|uniref:acyltransferase family protein n=1 Tax=Klebsiella spallanzanii TaxID=2587528 RepID=UPI002595618F|nr:acyltransferase [Klebsiella spallanzanii]MDM4207496.1 acyltransferase [Klebsiella spallanzanii]
MSKTMRESWVDYAKGIGILLVVFGHVNRGLQGAAIIIPSKLYYLVDSIIYSFHMPLFFFLSGLFFIKSIEKKGKLVLFIDKLKTVAYPYLVWSLLQGTIEVLLSKFTNSKASFTEVLMLFSHPRAQFWFLYALLMIFILSVIIYSKRFLDRGIVVLFVIFSFVYIYSDKIGTIYNINYINQYMVFFVLGVLFNKLKLDAFYLKQLSGCNLFAVAVFLFIVFLCSQYYFHFELKLYYFDIGIASLCLALISIFFIVSVSLVLSRVHFPLLSLLGEMSMIIYLLHILVASGSRVILMKVLHINDWIAHATIGLFAGIIIPIIIYRYIKNTKLKYLFSI